MTRVAGLKLTAAAALLGAAVCVAAGHGAVRVPASVVVRALAGGLAGRGHALDGDASIVWLVRVPRVLGAAVVGAALGAAGAATQGLFRNPLADPYLLGLASGAALGVTLAVALGAPAPLLPACAFAGSLAAVAATLLVARAGAGRGARGSASLVLAGVTVASIVMAAVSWLLLRDGEQLRAIVTWTMGNLALSGWGELSRFGPYVAIGLLGLLVLARRLDVLQLGDDAAAALGVDVRRTRLLVILAATLATSASIAFAGTIGFVGLVAPHVVRRLVGVTHRLLVVGSAVVGATLLVAADLGARTLVRPEELPVGVVTALLGGPFFLWLLAKR